jgi:phospholipid/cholesterol/gamma-HCH transport system ATP-binding protein
MGASEYIVEFQGVKKAFGPKVIYEDLTLGIRRGETLVVMGGSGTGKSVLLKLMIGLLKPDAGRILVDGEDIVGRDEIGLLPVRRRISMLFQGGALFDSLSVGENVAWPIVENPDRWGRLDGAELARRVATSLERVGLPGIEHQRPADLSGGMKKRVALARAIVAEPEVIMYDEPTTGLDPMNTRRISELIRKLQAELGVTSVVVTHDLPSAFLVADRIAMLHERRIRTVLPAAEFVVSPDPVIQEFVTAMPVDKTVSAGATAPARKEKSA